MSLPTSYLTSMKNLSGILNSIVGAQAPERFTTRFLESLGYANATDRLMIAVLKSLGFLADDGRPTQRYFDYLDQTRSASVMAEAVREAYADLFRVNKQANKLSRIEVTNKLKTLTQGQYSEGVLEKMAATFGALCSHSDFEAPRVSEEVKEAISPEVLEDPNSPRLSPPSAKGLSIGGLVYNIELVLPESRDPKVYDALFESLRRHLT
ncbi:MAG: DUF5343 domain-containing protein [Pseudomonadota bacterium]